MVPPKWKRLHYDTVAWNFQPSKLALHLFIMRRVARHDLMSAATVLEAGRLAEILL
jgi:hypothetical protein